MNLLGETVNHLADALLFKSKFFEEKREWAIASYCEAHVGMEMITRYSWLYCTLQDDEAVYWVSIGYYEAVAVGNWWYWVSRGHWCLYLLHKVEIWTGVTYAWLTDWLWKIGLLSTQLLLKYKSGALVTQCVQKRAMHPASQDKKHFNPSRQPSQAFVKLLRSTSV